MFVQVRLDDRGRSDRMLDDGERATGLLTPNFEVNTHPAQVDELACTWLHRERLTIHA